MAQDTILARQGINPLAHPEKHPKGRSPRLNSKTMESPL